MNSKNLLLGLAGLGVASLVLASCGSNTTDMDAGTTMPGDDAGPVIYPLSEGTYCYDVKAISPGYADGCQLAVASLVGQALPGTYVSATGQFTLGTEGSLGTGLVNANVATLQRDGTMTDSTAPTCSWHQTDTTTMTMTGQNMFTAAVVETENTFAAACNPAPTGGTCTSSWTWTLAINANKIAPACQ